MAGEKTIIALLSKIFEGAGNYFYENYTKDGEFKKLSGQFKDIVSNLKLLSELGEMGVDIEKPEEILRNSLIQIAKKIEENLGNQYKMNINGKYIQIVPEEQKTDRKPLVSERSEVDPRYMRPFPPAAESVALWLDKKGKEVLRSDGPLD